MFREFLNNMREHGKIINVDKEVNMEFEIARYLEKNDNKAIVEFNKIMGSDFKLLGNVCANRDILAVSIGTDDIHQALINALRSPIETEIVDNAPFFDNVVEPKLTTHPIPKFFREDAGRYYTSGLIITKSPDTEIHNSSIHRQLLLDDKHTTARIVPRHLYRNLQIAKERKEDLPIAIAFGLHPAVLLAASTPTDISLDEMLVANSLLGGTLKRVRLPNGILVPDHAEVVYEGVILYNQTAKEGPFVDITGTLDSIRDEPKIRIDRVYYRNNAYFTTILPSRTEHFILMGIGREAKIKEYVQNVVPRVKDVYLSTGGAGWLHAIISVDKQTQGDGKNVIMAAFAAHPSLKWVTVVDTDIDIFDPIKVEWATITRTGENDIIIIPKARGSSLDPARDEKEKVSIKVGIDATKDIYKDPMGYTYINIPGE